MEVNQIMIDGKLYNLTPVEEKRVEENHNTGYERALYEGYYYYIDSDSTVNIEAEFHNKMSNAFYKMANYYTRRAPAENNARADALMRKLRRYSAENDGWKIDWNDKISNKWRIHYDYDQKALCTGSNIAFRIPFVVYFHSKEIAEAAIEEFKEELLWYFKEYKWVL